MMMTTAEVKEDTATAKELESKTGSLTEQGMTEKDGSKGAEEKPKLSAKEASKEAPVICARCGSTYIACDYAWSAMYCSEKCSIASATDGQRMFWISEDKMDDSMGLETNQPGITPVEVAEKIESYKSMLLLKAASESYFSTIALKLAREVKELKPGMKLETLDKNNPCNYCIATVIEVKGHRLRVRYDGFGNDSSQDFWCDFQAEELFPIGWCASNGYPLQPPTGIKSSLEEWKTFLTKTLTGALAAPVELFREAQKRIPRKVHGFQAGMTVECVHPKVPWVMCMGVITKSLGPYYYVVTTDTCKEAPSVSFCGHSESPLIFPVGWCKKQALPMMLSASALAKGLSMEQYLALCATKAAPPTALYRQPPKACKFRVGQKLEAVDMEVPSVVRVATIYGVLGRLIQIKFDGVAKYQFCDSESQSLYPIGWCAQTGHPLHSRFGIVNIKSSFKIPLRVPTPSPTVKCIPKQPASESPVLLPLPSFRSVVERFHITESKVFFNKNCLFGSFLNPVKVMEASSCTMPSRPAVVIRRTLERLLCVSKSPERLAQVIQEGMEPKLIVRGKVVKKNLQQYDNKSNAVKFLKLLCRRLRSCEYFLSFNVQYGSGCPLQCKLKVSADADNEPFEHPVPAGIKLPGNKDPVTSVPSSTSFPGGKSTNCVPTSSAVYLSRRPILPSNLQPSVTANRSPLSPLSTIPPGGGAGVDRQSPAASDSPQSASVNFVTSQSGQIPRLIIGNSVSNDPRVQLVANRLRNTIQKSQLHTSVSSSSSSSTLAATMCSTQQRVTLSQASPRAGERNVPTVLIFNNAGAETGELSSVNSGGRHLPADGQLPDADGTRQVRGTLLVNRFADGTTAMATTSGDMASRTVLPLDATMATPGPNGENVSVSMPSTLIIPKQSLLQVSDSAALGGGKFLLHPVQLAARSSQGSDTSTHAQSPAPVTLVSSLSSSHVSLTSSVDRTPHPTATQMAASSPLLFRPRNPSMPGRFSVISTQHSHARRGIAIAPPANGVVRSPLRPPTGNLRQPNPSTMKSPIVHSPGLPVVRMDHHSNAPSNVDSSSVTSHEAGYRTEGKASLAPHGSPIVTLPVMRTTSASYPHGNIAVSSGLTQSSVLLSYPGATSEGDGLSRGKGIGSPLPTVADAKDPNYMSNSTNSVSVAYVSLQSNSKDKIMYVPLRPGVGLNKQMLLYPSPAAVQPSPDADGRVASPASSHGQQQNKDGRMAQLYCGGKIVPTTQMTSFRIQGSVVNGLVSSADRLPSYQAAVMASSGGEQQQHGVYTSRILPASSRTTSASPALILPRRTTESNENASQLTNGTESTHARYPVWTRNGVRQRRRRGANRHFTRKKGLTNQKRNSQSQNTDEDDDEYLPTGLGSAGEQDTGSNATNEGPPRYEIRQGRKRSVNGELLRASYASMAGSDSDPMEDEVTSQSRSGKSAQGCRIEPADRRVRQANFLVDPLTRVQLPNDPEQWSADDVAKFIEATDCPFHADEFRAQEIDGKALLLLTREALMDFAGFKLGPALKVCSYIAQLKTRTRQNHNEPV